jgi:pilus assembly protein CpaE
MAILIESDSAAVEVVRSVLGAGEDLQAFSSDADLPIALAARPNESLVIFGPDSDLQAALSFAAAQRAQRPGLGVILIRRRIDSALSSQSMRSGVREVLRAGSTGALAEACDRSRQITAQVTTPPAHTALVAPTDAGRVVTVFSAKGGYGKTTIATNIASSLASQNRRVCLVDLDLPFGDVAIMLQLDLDRTIADAITMTGHMDELGLRSIVTAHPSGLDVVVAPLDPADAERITPALVADLLHQLKCMYEVVVVDTPPAFTEPVLAALDLTDLYLLVTTLDIPAVKNLKLTLEMLEMLNHPLDKQRILVNRADAQVGLTVADVAQALRRHIALEVPSSRDVPTAINKGVPLVLDQPNHAVSAALREFVARDICARQASVTSAGRAAHAKRVPFLRRGSVPA